MWQAQEVIYNAHTKHGSHLKVNPTFNEILKAGYRWDNMIVDIRDFYFKCQVLEVRKSKPRKSLIVKHIDSHKPKERYQAVTVLLSDYIRDDFKYLFTMVDHFTKYGWIIPIKDKKLKLFLKHSKYVLLLTIVLNYSGLTMEVSLKIKS